MNKLQKAFQKFVGITIPKIVQSIVPVGFYSNLISALSYGSNPKGVKYFAGWVFACINMNKNTTSNLNFYPELKTKDGYEPLPENHWLTYLLANINYFYGFKTLLNLGIFSLESTGNFYIWTPTFGLKVPCQMWLLRAENVVTITNQYNQIEKYEFYGLGGMVTIPPSEMIHIKTLSLDTLENSMFRGAPVKINAAMDAILTAGEKMYFARNFMNRDGASPYIVKTPNEISKDSSDAFMANLKNSVPLEFQPKMIFPEGMELGLLTQATSAGTGITDVNYEIMTEQICADMGTPKDMILAKLLSRTTANEVKTQYYDYTIYPYADMIVEAFTKHFQQYEPEIRFTYDKYILSDPAFELLQNESDMKFGIKNRDTILLERGYKEIADGSGQIYFMQQGMTTVDSVLNPYIPEPESSPAEIQNMLKKKLLI